MVTVHMGNVIPFDGEVSGGEGMVNQVSLTGEAMPVRRGAGAVRLCGDRGRRGRAGRLPVKAVSGSTRFEKIVAMIEDSEKLKSSMESRAEHLADRLVPYTLLGTAGVWLLTRNVTKALSVLMGGLLLRAEACHAADRVVGDPGGRRVRDHCEGRKIP